MSCGPLAGRSTGFCARGIIGCPSGINRSIPSPPGISFRGLPYRQNTMTASSIPGGTTRKKLQSLVVKIVQECNLLHRKEDCVQLTLNDGNIWPTLPKCNWLLQTDGLTLSR